MQLPNRRLPETVTTVGPTPVPLAAIETYGEQVVAPRIAWVPDPHDPARSVAIDARLLQPVPASVPRDLTPQPLIDPVAARMVGGGLGAGAAGAGLGWGIGQAAAGIAALGTTIAVLALLLLATRTRSSARAGDTHITHITATGLFGRATSTTTHR